MKEFIYKKTETVEYTYKIEARDREDAEGKLEGMGHSESFSHKLIDIDTVFIGAEELMTEDDDSGDEPNERLLDEKVAEMKNEL